MFRRALLVTALITTLVIPASAADFIDEQVGRTPLPVKEAGWSGAYVDDSNISVFASMMYAGPRDLVNQGRGVYCASFSDPNCSSQERFTYNAYLPKCETQYGKTEIDCIKSLEVIGPDGKVIQAEFQRYFPETEKVIFTGEPAKGVASGWNPSIWTFPGINHSGGNEFLVIPSIISYQAPMTEPGKFPQLFVNIYAIKRTPSTDSFYSPGNKPGAINGLEMSGHRVNSESCPLLLGNRECAVAYPLPADLRFRIALTTSSNLSGWMHGRLKEPLIEVTKAQVGTGTTLLIEAGSVKVPVFSIWKKFESLSTNLKNIIIKSKGQKGRVMFPEGNFRDVYDGASVEPYDKISVEHDLDNHTQANFDEFVLWMAESDNKSIAEKSQWAFYTNHVYSEDDKTGAIRRCSDLNPNVSGVVTTNATMYLADPPKFNSATGSLDYQVSSPHFDRTGGENVGTYDLLIDGNVARCIYGYSSAPLQASVSIINSNGEAKVATSVLTERNGWLRLSVKGFTYSTPTIRIKLTQESAKGVQPETTQSQNQPTPKPAVKSTITCLKGKTLKKVTAISPKCPNGYKKK